MRSKDTYLGDTWIATYLLMEDLEANRKVENVLKKNIL